MTQVIVNYCILFKEMLKPQQNGAAYIRLHYSPQECKAQGNPKHGSFKVTNTQTITISAVHISLSYITVKSNKFNFHQNMIHK